MATRYEALKRSAGRFEFAPGQLLDLDRADAKELLGDGAVRLVEVTSDGHVRPVEAKKKEKRATRSEEREKPDASRNSQLASRSSNEQSGSSGELDELGEKVVKPLQGAGIKSLNAAKKYLDENGSFDGIDGLSKLASEQLREWIVGRTS